MTLRPIDMRGETPRAAPAGERPDLEWVPVAGLRINDAYQRPIEKRGRANILRIADNFDWGRFSPLLVARMDDNLFAVIDGQHRAHAAALCGIEAVPALVTDMDVRAQAAAFSWVNGSVTALTPVQIYRAALAALEPWAVQCDAVVASAGCQLMTFNKSQAMKKPGEVFCISTVRKLVEGGDSTVLVAVLNGLMAAPISKAEPAFFGAGWLDPMVRAAQGAGLVRGEAVAAFLTAHNPWKIAHAVDKLRMGDDPRMRGQPRLQLLTASLQAYMRAWARGAAA